MNDLWLYNHQQQKKKKKKFLQWWAVEPDKLCWEARTK